MNITVIGLGYVGLPLALCADTNKYSVSAIDSSFDRIEILKERKLPIKDSVLEEKLKDTKVHFTTSLVEGLQKADLAFVCVPTDWDDKRKILNTDIIENVIAEGIKINNSVTFVIKSTVSYGFTKKLSLKLNYEKILFSPEFLREGSAGFDTMHPSRIIIGYENEKANVAGAMEYLRSLAKEPCPEIIMSTEEAESVKLFANSYLATRVAFFNELSTFALKNNLDASNIINGMCLDPRIGNYYNKPSFGFGGYCLPKDSLQCGELFFEDESAIIKNLLKANELRKDFIANYVVSKGYNVIGIDRLVMKPGSDNFRESASMSMVSRLGYLGKQVIVYEPGLENNPWANWGNIIVTSDRDMFESTCDIILSDAKIERIKNKYEI